MSASLRGVFAPVLTPFHEDLSPDVNRWITFCKHLLDTGCHGLCPFGTTSEANSLGMDERMEMLEQLIAAGISPDVLMPGTGACAIPDAVKLTSHSGQAGLCWRADAAAWYYKGVPDEGVFAGIAEVIERVGDDRLRIYLYHIPPINVIGYSIPVVERLIKEYPSVVVGLKDSSRDWDYQQALLTGLPDFATFTGAEVFLKKNLELGGVGTISAMANVHPGLLRQLYDGWQSDEADALQALLIAKRATLLSDAPIPSNKALVADQMGDAGWRTMRPPWVTLDEDTAAKVVADYQAA